MKRTLLCLLLIAAALFTAGAQPSRLVTDSLHSEILGVTKHFTVYLPDGYGAPDGVYPVLYLLHGAWDDHNSWPVKGNMKRIADATYRSGMATPAVIVMPDASGDLPDNSGYRMGYFDKPDWEYERYFFTEFIPHVEGASRDTARYGGSDVIAGRDNYPLRP